MGEYIKLTEEEANSIGFYRINNWLGIDAKAGELKEGGYALPEAVVDDLKKYRKTSSIKGINLHEKDKIALDKKKFKKDKIA